MPDPYVVPGGRFREMYYWDSYFTMLGLATSGRHDLVDGMVRDFAYLIDTYGHVPNGARTYYLSRSQPPFFFAMVGLVSPKEPGQAFAAYLPQLRREYAFWMEGAQGLRAGTSHRHVVALPDGSVLNRFWDDTNTPRDESYREDTELARGSHRPAPQLFRDIRAAAVSGRSTPFHGPLSLGCPQGSLSRLSLDEKDPHAAGVGGNALPAVRLLSL